MLALHLPEDGLAPHLRGPGLECGERLESRRADLRVRVVRKAHHLLCEFVEAEPPDHGQGQAEGGGIVPIRQESERQPPGALLACEQDRLFEESRVHPFFARDLEESTLPLLPFLRRECGESPGGGSQSEAAHPPGGMAHGLEEGGKGLGKTEPGEEFQGIRHHEAVTAAEPNGHEGADSRLSAERLQTKTRGRIFDRLDVSQEALGGGWLGERFHLLGGMERHERGFAGGPELDTLLLAAGTLVLREGLTLEAGAGAAPNPSFSPVWNAHLEAGLALGGGFTAFARFWHLEFRGGGVEVLSPALRYDGAGFWASLRGWYAIEKEDGGLALLGQLGFDLPLRLGAWVGAGGGDRADYLVIRDAATERHLVWLTGISWSPGEGYVFSADYVGRHEAVADAEFYRHEILFGLLRRW